MSNGRRPDMRITFKSKDGTRYDVAAGWNSERFPGLVDVKPQKTNESGQYPKMRLSEAAAMVERGEGFLSISTPKKQDAPTQQRSFGGGDDPGGDDGIPFRQRNKRGPE